MNALLIRIENAFPGAVLEKKPFGRSGVPSLWIKAEAVPEIARMLKEDPAAGFSWLENLVVAEIEGSLVLTYFLKSGSTGQMLVLRATLEPKNADALVEIGTVSTVWPMAIPLEAEASALFGIKFNGNTRVSQVLPDGWEGFPLRKSYVFPVEFMDISHMRVAGSTSSEEGKA